MQNNTRNSIINSMKTNPVKNRTRFDQRTSSRKVHTESLKLQDSSTNKDSAFAVLMPVEGDTDN